MFSTQDQLVADLHLHSPYSRAVSPQMTLAGLRQLARWKGINLVAAADWTHPIWFAKLQQELQEVAEGIFELKPAYRRHEHDSLIITNAEEPLFLLATEISCIFSQDGKLRRVHLLLWVPSFSSAEKIISALQQRGAKLGSDGRPVIGMSCHDLTALALTADQKALVIPAHAWTPWFGVLGSKGGFESLEAAFGDLTPHIYALETGLSSDPAMNWQVSDLDHVSIVSFGDAHSLPKVGREVTVFSKQKPDYTYHDLWQALSAPKTGKNEGTVTLRYTIEFYPEEGKYHWDGHRACGVVQPPSITREKGSLCPVCAKPLTVGVEYRVDELADTSRLQSGTLEMQSQESGVIVKHNSLQPHRPAYINLVPLVEIIAEVLNKKVGTQAVNKQYQQLLAQLGSEFHILLNESVDRIAQASTRGIAEAVEQVRQGKLRIKPGFDGVYGQVTLDMKSQPTALEQASLF